MGCMGGGGGGQGAWQLADVEAPRRTNMAMTTRYGRCTYYMRHLADVEAPSHSATFYRLTDYIH